jgi:hypothetical protein
MNPLIRLKQFEEKHRKRLTTFVRIFIGLLFIFSAIAKLFPIEIFEKQLIDISKQPGLLFEFTNWCDVRWWSRTIISIELFIGISLLAPYFLKRFFIPISILLLLAFISHLVLQINITGNIGNCGCMGGWLPMTPLEAIIKNVITITLLIYVFSKGNDNETLPIYFHICGFTTVILFTILNSKWTEKCCCDDKKTTFFNERINLLELKVDSLNLILSNMHFSDSISENIFPPKHTTITSISEFHDFTNFVFNGEKIKSQIDLGVSMVIIANPDCDHCQELASIIAKLKIGKTKKVFILFFNPDETEEEFLKKQINSFIKTTSLNAPYTILSSNLQYVKLLGNAIAPPRLVILKNGTVQYECIENNDLNLNEIKKLMY